MCASNRYLPSLTPVYHCAMTFITGCSRLTHHHLYSNAKSADIHILWPWSKFIIVLLPTSLCTCIQRPDNIFVLQSKDSLHLYLLCVNRTAPESFELLCPLCLERFASWTKTVRTRSAKCKKKKKRQHISCQQCPCVSNLKLLLFKLFLFITTTLDCQNVHILNISNIKFCFMSIWVIMLFAAAFLVTLAIEVLISVFFLFG